MKNQSLESRSVLLKLHDSITQYPGRWTLGMVVLVLSANKLSGPLKEGQNDAKPKAPAVTASPFGAAESGWESKFTVTTTGGLVLDLACRGTDEVLVHTGDTLTHIASGVETAQLGQGLPQLSNESIVQLLADVNNVKDPDVVYAGQSLVKPIECAVMDADAN